MMVVVSFMNMMLLMAPENSEGVWNNSSEHMEMGPGPRTSINGGCELAIHIFRNHFPF